MKVAADPAVNPATDSTALTATAGPTRAAAALPAPAPPKTRDAPAVAALGAGVEAPVTFTLNRDSTGRIYYVVTNSQTGQEIGQLPPEELRNVDDGIAEYVKQQEAKTAANQHIETKA